MVLHLRTNAPDWDKAKCHGYVSGPHPVEPDDLPDYDPWSYDEATAMDFCNGPDEPCPIRHECLLFALTNNCAHGVWGGMSEVDRKALRKRWPLGRGTRTEGQTVWEPRSEWRWMPPGEASEGLDRDLLKLEVEEDTE